MGNNTANTPQEGVEFAIGKLIDSVVESLDNNKAEISDTVNFIDDLNPIQTAIKSIKGYVKSTRENTIGEKEAIKTKITESFINLNEREKYLYAEALSGLSAMITLIASAGYKKALEDVDSGEIKNVKLKLSQLSK